VRIARNSTQGEEVGTVAVSGTAWQAIYAIRFRAVFTGCVWPVIGLVTDVLHAVVVITSTARVLCAHVVCGVTDIARRTVRVQSTATKMVSTSSSTHRGKLRAIVIGRTSRKTRISITIFTCSVRPGGVTYFLGTVTVFSTFWSSRNTPVTLITYVALRTVRVFITLGQTNITHTGLPVKAITRCLPISTVHLNGPFADRAIGPLEVRVEGEGPLTLALRIAVKNFLTICTLKETSLI